MIFQLRHVLRTSTPTALSFFETDRREAGEWDNFYSRIAPYSYQGVFCVLINGEFDYRNSEGIAYHLYEKTHPEVSDYPRTLKYLEKGQDPDHAWGVGDPLSNSLPMRRAGSMNAPGFLQVFLRKHLGGLPVTY